jgi:hypothetical protein
MELALAQLQQAAGPDQRVTARVYQIPSPGTTIMLAEVRGRFTRLGGNNGSIVDGPLPVGGHGTQITIIEDPPVKTLHHPYWNYLFCDGSVRRLRPEQTLTDGRQASGMWTRNPHD